jgi:hypothetical protein
VLEAVEATHPVSERIWGAARADFERRTHGFEYVSPIPEGQAGLSGFALPVSAPWRRAV